MGKAISLMTKPVKKFNIENRVQAVISREKPLPAPTYKSTKKQLDVARSVNPNFMENHYKKDAGLDDRLKNVYVQSHDPEAYKIETNPDRPLPLSARMGEDFEYGFWEPQQVSDGRCTLRMVIAFMTEYVNDPAKHSAEAIAKEYKLNVEDVSNILKYFRVYRVVVPEGKDQLAYVEREYIQSGSQRTK